MYEYVQRTEDGRMSDETLKPLLAIEMAEQSTWTRGPMSAFAEFTGDPRNESGGATGGGEGGEGGGEGGSTTTGGEGGGGEGGGAGGAPDFMSAFESFRDDMEGRFDGLESRIPTPPEPVAQETPAPPDVWDPRNFSDEDFDAEGLLTREAQQRALQEQIDQRVAEALSPVMQARAQERRDAQANALEQRYPDLQNPEVLESALEAAQQRAAHMAQATGDSTWAEAWREPDFFETVYLSEVGRKAARGETPAGRQQGVTLEQGGSAGPGGAGGGDDGNSAIANGIVAVAQKQRFRLGTK